MSEESLVELVGCWKVTIETKAHSSLVSGLIHAVGACRPGSESFMISQAIAADGLFGPQTLEQNIWFKC
jgi:hypothetical protein